MYLYANLVGLFIDALRANLYGCVLVIWNYIQIMEESNNIMNFLGPYG
jgi:hypothetical protein